MVHSFGNLNNAAKSFAVTAATVLVLQASPNTLFAQSGEKSVQTTTAAKSTYMKFFRPMDGLMVGMENGTPVYKNTRGEFFTLNSTTGDMKFIKPEEFAKFNWYQKHGNQATSRGSSFTWKCAVADAKQVTVVGSDKEGHIIQQNSRGETYYVHPETGDLVFVK
jgi:hypothetical protein